MSARTEPCSGCGVQVTREMPDGDGGVAQMLRTLPLVCDECVARAEEEDAERQRRDAERDRAAKVAERIKRSGLPAKYIGLQLRDLEHPGSLLDAAFEWATIGGGLLLAGEIGRGKTTVAGAACWLRLQRAAVQWTSAPLLFARLGSGLGTEQRNWALELLSAKYGLVLDDVDKARPTEYGAEQVFLAIDQRVEHEAPLLVTTNLSPGQLAEKWPEPYGPAIASRLVGYCRVVKVEGADRRLWPVPIRDGAA